MLSGMKYTQQEGVCITGDLIATPNIPLVYGGGYPHFLPARSDHEVGAAENHVV